MSKTGSKQQPRAPRILVVGAGAVGGLYGGKLAQAGAEVSTVSRSDYGSVRRYGIRVQSIWGDFRFRPHSVLRQPADYDGFPDYVLVTTKVLPAADTAALIRPVVGPGTVIVLLQNGIEIEAPVAAAFPDREVISGLAFVCTSRVGPGRIQHLDYGRVKLGTYPRGISDACRRLEQLLTAAGVPAEVTDNALAARWEKLVWNAPFNAVSVIAGATTHEILALDEGAVLARRVMEEVCRVAAAAGAPLGTEVINRNLSDTYAMTPYKTSMLLDYEAGRPMEVEAILGNAVRAARRLSVPVPRLQAFYALLQLLAAR